MYPLFESICIKNGIIQNFEWHEKRYVKSYKFFYKKKPKKPLAYDLIIPESCNRGTFKLRLSYNENQQIYEFVRYEIKEINSLKLIYDNKIKYALKYSDRSHLISLFEEKGKCDDILIVKNNLISDSSYCNIAFYDGYEWATPAEPLLEGTARARLLEDDIIYEDAITVDMLRNFTHFKLFNAMRDFDWVKASPIDRIQI